MLLLDHKFGISFSVFSSHVFVLIPTAWGNYHWNIGDNQKTNKLIGVPIVWFVTCVEVVVLFCLCLGGGAEPSTEKLTRALVRMRGPNTYLNVSDSELRSCLSKF